MLCGNLWIVTRKWKVQHRIEIHPDGMIDDEFVFSIDDIGANWPELQLVDDNPDCMVLSGIVGNRFIEQFATCNRLDEWDRTPEVLAADLELAMEQLWGRREAMLPVEEWS